MSVELITDERALADLCRSLATAEWLALDTEFLRERTYRARLCLVQIADRTTVACVDPLAMDNLGPLLTLLHAAGTVKVLHAARQDLEVFFDIEQRVPAPVFDTQIAAAFLGYDDQIGYGALVQAITGVALAKTETRTDWSKRPLSAAQLEYAADDVRHLRPVYESLREQLMTRGRLAWVEAECAALDDPALYRVDPADAWRRLRGGADLPPAGQQILRALCTWREREAQARDLPRGWVLRDEVLYELARRAPDSTQALAGVPGLDERAGRRHANAILSAVAEGRAAAPEAIWARSTPLTPAQAALVKQLMGRVRELATQQALAPAVLATRRDIERLVRGAEASELWQGWRAELLVPTVTPLLARSA